MAGGTCISLLLLGNVEATVKMEIVTHSEVVVWQGKTATSDILRQISSQLVCAAVEVPVAGTLKVSYSRRKPGYTDKFSASRYKPPRAGRTTRGGSVPVTPDALMVLELHTPAHSRDDQLLTVESFEQQMTMSVDAWCERHPAPVIAGVCCGRYCAEPSVTKDEGEQLCSYCSTDPYCA